MDNNFIVELHEDNDVVIAKVIESPAGQTEGTIDLTGVDHEFLKKFLKYKGIPLGDEPEITKEDEIKLRQWSEGAIGSIIFESFFGDEQLRLCLKNSLEKTSGRLRFLIKADPQMDQSSRFLQIPWESMRPNGFPAPIFQDDDCTFVQYLDLDNDNIPAHPKGRLKLALVLSQPQNQLAFGEPEFRTSLKQELRRTEIDVDIIEPANRKTLIEHFKDNQYHFVQFVGHGGFDPHQQTYTFLLTDENHVADPISGEGIAKILHNTKPTLRLVNMITCNGGRTSKWSNFNWFGSLAGAMVENGIPNVIAMQYPISVAAAKVFNREFFPELLKTLRFDRALAHARRQLSVQRENFEWATPTWFTSQNHDCLFKSPKAAVVHINTVDPIEIQAKADSEKVLVPLNFVNYFHNRETVHEQAWLEMYDAIWALKNTSLKDAATIEVKGDSALSLWTAFGFVFGTNVNKKIFGHQLNQAGEKKVEPWPTQDPPGRNSSHKTVNPLFRDIDKMNEGEDLIISIGISNWIDEQVKNYIWKSPLQIKGWLKYGPADPGRTFFPNSLVAYDYSIALATDIREKIQENTAERVHLFYSAPKAFLLSLGRQLNGVGDIQLYEWANSTYYPSINLERLHG